MSGEIPDLSREQLEDAAAHPAAGDALPRVYSNVPHYRHAFDEAGVRPEHLESLADLARFPFTTKADLRANYPFGMFAVPRDQVNRIHASSGTTGQADRRRLHRGRPRRPGRR